MTNYLISYDISQDKLRNKIVKILERRGCVRVQKSVFLAPRYQTAELKRLQAEMVLALKARASPDDSVLCVPLNKGTLEEGIWHGDNPDLQKALQKLHTMLI